MVLGCVGCGCGEALVSLELLLCPVSFPRARWPRLPGRCAVLLGLTSFYLNLGCADRSLLCRCVVLLLSAAGAGRVAVAALPRRRQAARRFGHGPAQTHAVRAFLLISLLSVWLLFRLLVAAFLLASRLRGWQFSSEKSLRVCECVAADVVPCQRRCSFVSGSLFEAC